MLINADDETWKFVMKKKAELADDPYFSNLFFPNENRNHDVMKVSFDSHGEMIGFFYASYDSVLNALFDITFICFLDKPSVKYGRDILLFLEEAFCVHGVRKICWNTVIGGPAEKVCDHIMEKFGGRVTLVFHDEVRSRDGNLLGCKEYELLQKSYLAKENRKLLDKYGRLPDATPETIHKINRLYSSKYGNPRYSSIFTGDYTPGQGFVQDIRKLRMVSLDDKGRICGYIVADFNMDTKTIFDVAMGDFSKNPSYTYGKSVIEFFVHIFEELRIHRATWMVRVGTFSEKFNDHIANMLGAHVAGIRKDSSIDMNGELYDMKVFEIMSADYFSHKKKNKALQKFGRCY